MFFLAKQRMTFLRAPAVSHPLSRCTNSPAGPSLKPRLLGVDNQKEEAQGVGNSPKPGLLRQRSPESAMRDLSCQAINQGMAGYRSSVCPLLCVKNTTTDTRPQAKPQVPGASAPLTQSNAKLAPHSHLSLDPQCNSHLQPSTCTKGLLDTCEKGCWEKCED